MNLFDMAGGKVTLNESLRKALGALRFVLRPLLQVYCGRPRIHTIQTYLTRTKESHDNEIKRDGKARYRWIRSIFTANNESLGYHPCQSGAAETTPIPRNHPGSSKNDEQTTSAPLARSCNGSIYKHRRKDAGWRKGLELNVGISSTALVGVCSYPFVWRFRFWCSAKIRLCQGLE